MLFLETKYAVQTRVDHHKIYHDPIHSSIHELFPKRQSASVLIRISHIDRQTANLKGRSRTNMEPANL
jgi:hypothetical protein